MALIHARADDWRPANPRISVGGWIGAIVVAVVLYIAVAAVLGHFIVGNGAPFLGSLPV
jgi:hypothetical protein